MVRSFILGGVLTTAIMFSGVSFASTNINTDSLTGMSDVNIQKTMDNVCMGKLLQAEPESKELLVFKIKKL